MKKNLSLKSGINFHLKLKVIIKAVF